jgi:hypothetical protein
MYTKFYCLNLFGKNLTSMAENEIGAQYINEFYDDRLWKLEI